MRMRSVGYSYPHFTEEQSCDVENAQEVLMDNIDMQLRAPSDGNWSWWDRQGSETVGGSLVQRLRQTSLKSAENGYCLTCKK